jgi:hypothetical protein
MFQLYRPARSAMPMFFRRSIFIQTIDTPNPDALKFYPQMEVK